MFKDKPLRPKVNYNAILIVCILGANVIAVLAFSSYCSTSGRVAQDESSRRDLMGTTGTILDNSLSTSVNHLLLHLNDSRQDIRSVIREMIRMRQEVQELREKTEVLTARIAQLTEDDSSNRDSMHNRVNERVKEVIDQMAEEDEGNNPWMQWAKGKMPKELQEYTALRKLPLGWNPALGSDTNVASVGHGCAYNKDDMAAYMNYEVGKDCPEDEPLQQKLVLKGCEPLPRRRCFARKPPNSSEPVPWPESMWTVPDDNNILWTAYRCKSFQCLNERAKLKVFEDCLDCFDLNGREKHRWFDNPGSLDFLITEVLKLKPPGTIRIGLDIGGGTASFAARMRENNVTIVTSTLNLAGPFNNFIAQRGLVPLFLTISQRLPFFDNTLDIVHSMHVLSNWIPTETLEFLLYDIDRVLRPGGLFWVDHFFCVESQLELYVSMIDKLGYTKHKWHVGKKLDRGPEFNESYTDGSLINSSASWCFLSTEIHGDKNPGHAKLRA
ncbi:hypothetical protein R1sor_005618 [Riccia sorocarpa]|uniref:Methyltransferase type 11 domain-containing protein n=1 Tax=Riccia sorocarpa TaxID=122646 RepID=A0ABD3HKC6_9MARC